MNARLSLKYMYNNTIFFTLFAFFVPVCAYNNMYGYYKRYK